MPSIFGGAVIAGISTGRKPDGVVRVSILALS
jgi:hypothetical protein